MRTTTAKTLLAYYVVPALLGWLVFFISIRAALWDCQVPGCTHCLKNALMAPNRYLLQALEYTLGHFMGEALLSVAFPIMLIVWPVAGILVAYPLRRLVHRWH